MLPVGIDPVAYDPWNRNIRIGCKVQGTVTSSFGPSSGRSFKITSDPISHTPRPLVLYNIWHGLNKCTWCSGVHPHATQLLDDSSVVMEKRLTDSWRLRKRMGVNWSLIKERLFATSHETTQWKFRLLGKYFVSDTHCFYARITTAISPPIDEDLKHQC